MYRQLMPANADSCFTYYSLASEATYWLLLVCLLFVCIVQHAMPTGPYKSTVTVRSPMSIIHNSELCILHVRMIMLYMQHQVLPEVSGLEVHCSL